MKYASTFRPILLGALLTLACSAIAVTAEEPGLAAYSAEYKVKISILSGELTTDLRKTDDGFEAEHVIRPHGLAKVIRNGVISEKSRFSETSEGIRATWYQSFDTLSSDPTSAAVSFDWATHEISGKVNDEDVHMILDGLVHDRVAIQYQLMHDLMNGGAGDRYVLYDIDEFKTLVVKTIGMQEVRTPAGNFEALGIQHQAENSSRVTTLWCVPDLGYLPVMIEQHRKGKLRMRAVLEKYSRLET